jgi:hypothetical protein
MFYCEPVILTVECEGHGTMKRGRGEMKNAYKILVGKLESKRPLGRPRRRWEANI